MDREYMIRWDAPEGFDPTSVLMSLPSPIAPGLREIYNYSVKEEGFYFVDRQVDPRTAGEALKLFIDEALKYSNEVMIENL
jgi:hypothetical protein